MNKILLSIKPDINPVLYLKDPYSSELGEKILIRSIELINEIGLEYFTFKKLAEALSTTESSTYRYFENKHKLLSYLASWYWTWLEYRLVYTLANITDVNEKIKRAIHLLVFPVEGFETVNGMDMLALNHIIINESSKAYLTKEVDTKNKDGFFKAYKSFCTRISEIVKEYNPQYKFPNSIVSTVVEGIHTQKFFAEHLKLLSNCSDPKGIETLFFDLIIKTCKPTS